MGSTGAVRAGGVTRVEERDTDLQKFRGRPTRDGWEFEHNEWTEKWFKDHSDADKIISGMSPEERDAFVRWTQGFFMDGAQYRGWKSMSDIEQRFTRIYDKILDNATLSKGIIVYRRAGWELINNGSSRSMSESAIKSMIGQVIPCKGSMSTAAATGGLWGMGMMAKPVEYVIKVPAGKGAGMWVGDSRINPGWGPKQREFMTNRDALYRVDETHYDTKKGVQVVTLTYMGHEKHKYS